MNRRAFLAAAAAAAAGPAWGGGGVSRREATLGLLYGSAVGDACGGPYEFQPRRVEGDRRLDAMAWDGPLTAEQVTRLSRELPMVAYGPTRPGVEPYGQWTAEAPAGTVTDDTRHKMVCVDAVRSAGASPTAEAMAEAVLRFDAGPATKPVRDEALREYRSAARWVLGDRGGDARPPSRLWSGLANCSGQMFLLPLAVANAGRPVAAYRAAYEANVVDADAAKDGVSAVVAGLAAVLKADVDLSPAGRWRLFIETVRRTDPYDYAAVPFAGRTLDWVLNETRAAVAAAGRNARDAFDGLVDHFRPRMGWEWDFTLAVAIASLDLTECEPAAAIHLCLAFGRDTDSYAQLAGAIGGAVRGVNAFDAAHRRLVRDGLRRDYDTSVEEWADVLRKAAGR